MTDGKAHQSDYMHLQRLTPREREVLQHIAQGKRLCDIAGEMGIVPGTARRKASQVYAKIGVTSRTQAALWYLRHET